MNRRVTSVRSVALRTGFIVLFAAVVARIAYVQNLDRSVVGKGSQQWSANQTIKPMRGSIYDANGDRLAFDVPAYDLDMDIRAIQAQGPAKVRALAQQLSAAVGAPEALTQAQLTRKDVAWLRFYPYLADVSLARKQRVMAVFAKLGLQSDVNPYQTYKRVYPGGTFASQVIGFVDQSGGTGAAGVELQYNRYLTGTPGSERFLQDSLGNPIPFHPIVTQPVKNGDSVYLTIDAAVQHYAEEALATIAHNFHPAHAAIVVADPNTGAVLAMAALPNYNPNAYWAYPASTLDTNWAISDPFEPGSTFKIVTLTGALATHAINLNQTYMSGVDYVNGVPIHDWNWWGWGRITYRQAMIYSSNTGFIHIGQAEGPLTLAHYIHLYGMDKPTGIDLPGEGTSILFDAHNINAVDFATSTFGQGLAVTPIQQLQEVGAVANGGRLYTPYVVQRIVAPDGRVLYNRQPHVVRQVAPVAIMREITRVMVQDVNQDPGLRAYIPGYSLAGKTGTANIPKPGGGYYQNQYNLSFVGFVPASHPVFDIIVTVNEPHNTVQFGNDVASPAARFVLQKSLQYLQVPSDGPTGAAPAVHAKTVNYATVPDIVGDSVTTAIGALDGAGFTGDPIARTGRVTRQWPEAGQREVAGTLVTFVTTASAPSSGVVRVPNLWGMPMVQALSVCALLGLQLRPQGNGYASGQSAAPGSLAPVGSVLSVRFTPAPGRA